jgi:hypothetical protein
MPATCDIRPDERLPGDAPAQKATTLTSAETALPAHRPQGDQERTPATTVTVKLTVTETVTYEFQSEVELPANLLGDENELQSYLDENEELWLDDLDPTGKNSALYITERTLDEARVAETTTRS